MRGLLTVGLVAGLLISTTGFGAGGAPVAGAPGTSGAALILLVGTELSDQELSQVTGEFLPVWAAVGVVLVARISAKAIIAGAQGATVGAHAGAASELARQLLEQQRPFDPVALACAFAGGAVGGAVTGGRGAVVPAVAGGLASTVTVFKCGR